jgi:7-keto-8-aminopelargonate synthetase-like enzyme
VNVVAELVGAGDLILHDALIHNSVLVGARLSGAMRRAFPHNDFDALEAILAQMRDKARNVLIVVEGLYSMDGDTPDLARLADIKRRFGCWLMVDEAHALGVLGQSGRGSAEAQAFDAAAVDVWMGTLSKTLAACGGYVAGSAPLIDLLKCNAPGFVYSVGLAPPLAAAGRERLAERAHPHIDGGGVESLRLGAAASALSQHAKRMRFVDHQPAAEAPLDVGEPRKIGRIAVH